MTLSSNDPRRYVHARQNDRTACNATVWAWVSTFPPDVTCPECQRIKGWLR